MGTDISAAAMTALQNRALPGVPAAAASGKGNMAAIDKAARRVGEGQSDQNKQDAALNKAASEFESVFVSQFLGSMFSSIPTDGITGGGEGEEMFRSLMLDQYSQSMQKQGGFGLAASVKAEMLKMQGLHA